MPYKRILTVQDISCVGQCSLTVALPVISACGVETCVLPSAVLSTHTGGFHGCTFRDLTEDMPAILSHWQKEGITFDAIYTGYLGSIRQIEYTAALFDTAGDCLKIVDPAMADHGRLYTGFDSAYAEAMKGLCAKGDYLLPNITEASLLTGLPYRTEYDRAYIDALLEKLAALGAGNVVLTGVSLAPGKTGVVVHAKGASTYYAHDRLPNNCHGTGDLFASAFTGALTRGKTAPDAAAIAADFVVACLKATAKQNGHWYGAVFEPVLGQLIQALNAHPL